METTTQRSDSTTSKTAKAAGCSMPGLILTIALLAPLSTACASHVAVGVARPAPRTAAVVKVKNPPGSRHNVVVVRKAPPKPKREVVVVKPAGHHVWVAGHWQWQPKRGYVWKAGQWKKPPHRTAVWVKPRYEKRSSGWVYIAGRWR